MTDQRLDDLRDELRARGYLDARVDRFVLGGAARQARPFGVALAASVRIGMLAAVLLGPAAAIGLRSRAPGLITNLTDTVVASLYLGALFWVAAAVVSASAVLIGAAIARRMAASPAAPRRFRRAAAGAGVAVGLACLAYLTLWWRTAAGLGGAASAAMSLSVIAVAVAISLLLGHAVAVTVLACLVRLGFAPEVRRLPLSSVTSLLLMGGAALAGAFALMVALGSETAEAPPPRLTVVPTGLRVVVLAVDGVDPATLDRLRERGRLPAFGRLLAQGVATLPSTADRDPARVWTTVATGQPAERHGVRALESREVAGLEGRLGTDSPGWTLLAGVTDVLRLTRPAIASGAERLIPAFWEVAARAGFRTAVVHWWATWPAPTDAGIVLSDRAILRLEHPGPLDAEIAPASLYEALSRTWTDRRARTVARAAQLTTSGMSAETAAAVRRSAELDATIVELAREAAASATDLLAVYLPGLDIAQSALLGGSGQGLAPSSAAERLAALEAYYEFLDTLVADLLPGIDADNRLDVLVTWPGRAGGSADGRLAVSGRAAHASRGTLAPTAVAPTVLHALGLPVALDLAARPASDLFDPSFIAAHPLRTVATYGSRRTPTSPRTGQGLDREMIDRMRSLGYVR